jgi:hypothetical protein
MKEKEEGKVNNGYMSADRSEDYLKKYLNLRIGRRVIIVLS